MWGGRLRVSRSQHGTPCVGAPRVPHHHSGPCSFPQQQAWFYWKRRLRCRCGTVPQRSVKAVQGESRAGSGGLGTQLFHRARPAPTTVRRGGWSPGGLPCTGVSASQGHSCCGHGPTCFTLCPIIPRTKQCSLPHTWEKKKKKQGKLLMLYLPLAGDPFSALVQSPEY